MGDSTWVGGFDSHPNIFAAHEERRAHEEEERMSTALQHGRKAESAPPARSNCQGACNGTEHDDTKELIPLSFFKPASQSSASYLFFWQGSDFSMVFCSPTLHVACTATGVYGVGWCSAKRVNGQAVSPQCQPFSRKKTVTMDTCPHTASRSCSRRRRPLAPPAAKSKTRDT